MGKLIVIDGLDGSGKATQTQLLYDKISSMGLNVRKISFPDYESDSSALVKIYLRGELGENPDDVNPYAASSFYAVDRYVSYKKHWEKAYTNGNIILCDRYVTSNVIHQMAKLPRENWDGFLAWIHDYEYGKLSLPIPDGIIYLDMDLDISQNLMDKRYDNQEHGKDIHEKDLSYLVKCRQSAAYAAKVQKWEILKCCDEKNSIYDVGYLHDKIMNIVLQKIN